MKIILSIIVLIILLVSWSVFKRKQKLIRWANNVSLSKNQLSVLEQLASAEHTHIIPSIDPISILSDIERGELMYLCSPSAPPKELIQGSERWWVAFVLRAKNMGFTEDQSMILAGMDSNRLHPKYRSIK